jgi:hypothetical protein
VPLFDMMKRNEEEAEHATYRVDFSSCDQCRFWLDVLSVFSTTKRAAAATKL